MKMTLRYIKTQRDTTHRKGKIPIAVVLTKTQLDELNYDMRMMAAKARTKDSQNWLRPDLLPIMPEAPDIKDGDNLYGMDVYVGEEFKIKTMHG